MMTLALELAPDSAADLESKAKAKGLSMTDYIKQIVERDLQYKDDYVQLPPDQWIREFREWAESHRAMDLPSLSDEAISREFIYAERGL